MASGSLSEGLMVPPRLTGALRSFSNSKRLQRQELFSKEGLTWKKVTQFFRQHLDKAEQQTAAEQLKRILQAAKQIVGTDFGQETIESAAVFLFKTFYNKDQVGHEETRAIKQMFGPFPSSAAEASFAAIGQLAALSDEVQLEAFVRAQDSRPSLDRTPFGRNISFSYESYALDYLEGVPWACLEDGLSRDISLDFDRFLSGQQENRRDQLADGASAVRPPRGAVLREEVDRYLSQGNMGQSSAEELCTSLFEMLASHKTDDELQNELFELLGPEGFEMIERLLQRRTDIVDALLSAPPDQKLSHLTGGNWSICCSTNKRNSPYRGEAAKSFTLGGVPTSSVRGLVKEHPRGGIRAPGAAAEKDVCASAPPYPRSCVVGSSRGPYAGVHPVDTAVSPDLSTAVTVEPLHCGVATETHLSCSNCGAPIKGGRKGNGEGSKPTYGCQVTIQSEQERQMLKVQRREEKKRRERRGEEPDSSAVVDSSFHFDPKELRLQSLPHTSTRTHTYFLTHYLEREEQRRGGAPRGINSPPLSCNESGERIRTQELEHALLTARRLPLLGRQRDHQRIRYPHVYDAYAEATKMPAFVGGAKLLLPEGIKRENSKMFEEVVIPPNEPMPIGFEEKPVYIEQLDEVALLCEGPQQLLYALEKMMRMETGRNERRSDSSLEH
ncbi:activating signal cointegrator 1 complex subunit 3-like [Scleropages formosus]|uniref:Activating signal cointegrator 1 complex subunit 3-like n=1 Tax=Scleropages formosus TaxID=113540 RepID=A0A0P7XPF4_SCLFO|nr:activating signal cointegrator 1 complex subunit 3-like [Scleropages formosus]